MIQLVVAALIASQTPPKQLKVLASHAASVKYMHVFTFISYSLLTIQCCPINLWIRSVLTSPRLIFSDIASPLQHPPNLQPLFTISDLFNVINQCLCFIPSALLMICCSKVGHACQGVRMFSTK